MKLYEIAKQHRDFFDQLDDIPPEAVESTLEGLEGDFEAKALSVAGFFQNLEAEADAIDVAIERMKARKRSLENKIEWGKSYLLVNMQACGITKIECPQYSIGLAKNPPKVEILDEGAIPEQYKRTKVIVEIDKAAIKANGGCDGARISQGYRLVVK